MTVKLLAEHHLEFLSLIGGFTGSFQSTRVKIPHFWKSHVVAQMQFVGTRNVLTLATCTLTNDTYSIRL